MGVPLAFHNLTVASLLAETMVSPSGLYATSKTQSECLVREVIKVPSDFHNLTVLVRFVQSK